MNHAAFCDSNKRTLALTTLFLYMVVAIYAVLNHIIIGGQLYLTSILTIIGIMTPLIAPVAHSTCYKHRNCI